MADLSSFGVPYPFPCRSTNHKCIVNSVTRIQYALNMRIVMNISYR